MNVFTAVKLNWNNELHPPVMKKMVTIVSMLCVCVCVWGMRTASSTTTSTIINTTSSSELNNNVWTSVWVQWCFCWDKQSCREQSCTVKRRKNKKKKTQMHLYENRNVVGRKTTKQWNVANVAVVWSKKLLLSPSLLSIWVRRKKKNLSRSLQCSYSSIYWSSTGRKTLWNQRQLLWWMIVKKTLWSIMEAAREGEGKKEKE